MLSWKLDRTLLAPLLNGIYSDTSWPAAIRIVNALLHAGSAFFVFKILRRLMAGPRVAAFGFVAFLLHPVACESICWPIERKTLLAGLFAFASFWIYLRSTTWRGVVLAVLLYACALLSKPSALGLFAMLVVWETLGRPGYSAQFGAPRTLRSAVLRLIPWTLVTLGGIGIGFKAHSGNLIAPPGGNIFTALLTDVVILWRYIENFFWPANLSFYYEVQPVVTITDSRLWLCGLSLLALVSGTLYFTENTKRRLTLFGWFWFVGALGTNLNLVGLNDLMHDRFIYLSTPGLWLALGLGCAGLFQRLKSENLTRFAAPGICLAGLFWATFTAQRASVFHDLRPLLEDTVVRQPRSATAHLFLARHYQMLGRREQEAANREETGKLNLLAANQFDEGMAAPDFDRYLSPLQIHLQAGYAYASVGRTQDAARNFAIAFNPPNTMRYAVEDLAKAKVIQGSMDLQMKRPKEGLAHFEEALKLDPSLDHVHLLRVQALLDLRDQWTREGKPMEATQAESIAGQILEQFKEGDPNNPKAQELFRRLRQL